MLRLVSRFVAVSVVASAGSVLVLTSDTPASAQACAGCVVVSAPTISLSATARPGGQSVIDQQGGVAVYTGLTTGLIGGPGTVWLAGHRTSHGSVFNRVPFLVAGDPINLSDDTGSHQYIVNRLLVVPASGWQNYVDINNMSRSLLILQTSHPDPSLRYLIEAFGTLPEICRTAPLVTGGASLSTATTRFVSMPPQRLLDTRVDGDGVVCAGGNITLQLWGAPGISTTATAVALTVTATDSRGPGFVSVGPAGLDPSGTSTVNLGAAGQTRANLVMVAIGISGQIAIHVSVATHLIIDISGYFEPSTSARDGRFVDVAPERLLDTRTDPTQPRLHANQTAIVNIAQHTAQVPVTQASAVMVNLTAVNGVPGGYVTAWASGIPQPATSNVNLTAIGDAAANLAIVPLGADGSIQLFASTDLDVIIDVVGYFTNVNASDAAVGLFVPLTPRRVLDSRTSRPVLAAGTTSNFDLAGPAGIAEPATLVANITSTISHGQGFVSITDATLPSTAPSTAPSTSNLSVSRGEDRANLAIISAVNAQLVHVFVSLQTHIIIDVTGYFTAGSRFGSLGSVG